MLPRRRERSAVRRRRWLIGGSIAALVVVVAILGSIRLYRVATRLSSARADIVRAVGDVRAGRLAAAEQSLGRAQGNVTIANDTLHNSPELTLLELLPVGRQNVRSLRRSVGLLLELSDGGRRVLAAARPLAGQDGKVAVPLRAGAIPLPAVRSVEAQLRDAAFSLPGLAEEPGHSLLLGPVGSVQHRVFAEAALRRRQFSAAASGLELLRELAGDGGPRRYLIAVANAAEMRGSGGMILSYGVLTSANGTFHLDRVGPIDELSLADPVPATTPADYLERFRPLGPTRLWRNANLASDFRIVAPILERMYTAATKEAVDGVIQIDSVGLAALLVGTGPVDVPPLGTVTAQNAVALTLNEAYVKFPQRDVRQEYLQTVAEAVFRRIVTGDYPSVTPLAEALARAVTARHVIIHVAKAAPQRAAEVLGVSGGLPEAGGDFAQLTVQNFSANKLDYYLDTSLRVTGTRRPSRLSRLRATVELVNTAPLGGQPPYVFGPFNADQRAGEYRGLASLYLPVGAFLVTPTGPGIHPYQAAEAGRTVISFDATIPAGGRQTVSFEFELPPQPSAGYRFDIVPSPRVRPTLALFDVDLAGRRIRVGRPLTAPIVIRSNS